MGKPMQFAVSLIFCHLLYRIKYINAEQIKNLERCVICPNHTSTMDPFFIYPKTKNLYIMAKAELFEKKWLSKLFNHYNVFPVDRRKVDVKSTLVAVNIFKENTGPAQFLIFPEGKVIKENEEIGRVRNGAVFIAATSEVPIIPVHISQNVRLFRKINVTFGNPITINKEVLESKEKIKEESKKLLNIIYELDKNNEGKVKE